MDSPSGVASITPDAAEAIKHFYGIGVFKASRSSRRFRSGAIDRTRRSESGG